MSPAAAAVYRSRVRPVVRSCALLGQNLRFIVLGVTAVGGWPAGLLWITAIPMNLVLLWLVAAQEHRATGVLRALEPGMLPASPPPAVAVGGD
jgi:hypothetical protein